VVDPQNDYDNSHGKLGEFNKHNEHTLRFFYSTGLDWKDMRNDMSSWCKRTLEFSSAEVDGLLDLIHESPQLAIDLATCKRRDAK
jgi:hypothetical protein